jgi:hypothetical protein
MALGLYFLAQGILLNPQRRYRLAAVACFLGAVLSHSVSVVILPVWGLAVVICVAVGHKKFDLDWYRQRSIRLEVLILLLLALLAFGFGIVRQLPFLSPGGDTGAGGGGIAGSLQVPGARVSWERIDDFIYYYTSPSYWPLMFLGAGISDRAGLGAAGADHAA